MADLNRFEYLTDEWLAWAETTDYDKAVEIMERSGREVYNTLAECCEAYADENGEDAISAICCDWENGVGKFPLLDRDLDDQIDIYRQWCKSKEGVTV